MVSSGDLYSGNVVCVVNVRDKAEAKSSWIILNLGLVRYKDLNVPRYFGLFFIAAATCTLHAALHTGECAWSKS